VTFADNFAVPDDTGPIRASELHASLGESLGAQASEALDAQSGISAMQLWRRAKSAMAGGDMVPGLNAPDAPLPEDIANFDQAKAEIPDVSIADAKARVKQEGLDGALPLPDQPSIKAPVLDLMIQEAQEHRDREAAIARGPHGFFSGALGFATSIGAGMIDPVNMAAFSIPVLGEARWGKLLANAGDSLFARAGVRAVQGAAQGAVGTAALQPLDYLMHTADGRDYTMADALKSVIMGAGMGAAFHAGIGGVSDVAARFGGRALPGAADGPGAAAVQPIGETQLEGRGEAFGTPGEEVPGVTAPSAPAAAAPEADEAFRDMPDAYPPDHPASVLADLPPGAREDVARAAMADVINGRPVRAAEMLQEAAKVDPRIAETIDAWHGSPHDFDAFDIARIGDGEGAQSFGHGLYFAENEGVARRYRVTTSDASFIRKVQDIYDESSSPDEAAEAIRDSTTFNAGEKRLLTALQHDDWLGFDYPHQAVSAALRQPRNFDLSPERQKALADLGRVYRVKIRARPEQLLDWDKPLAEQSPEVKEAVSKLLPEGKTKWGFEPRTGEDFARAMPDHLGEPGPTTKIANRAKASEAMRNAGILGIKYLDQGSRARGEGTRNFVVFSDRDVEITHKNGIPVSRAEAKAIKAEKRAAKPQSLLEFIRAKGGVSEDDPLAADLLQSFGGENPNIRGKGKLVRPEGLSLDRLREAAVEAGYLHDHGDETGGASQSTIQDLLDSVDREARGEKQYPRGEELAGVDENAAHLAERSEAEREIFFHQAGEDIDRLLDQNGVTAIRPQIKNFALRLLERGKARDAEDAFHQSLDNFDMLGDRPQMGDADMADWQQFANAPADYEDPEFVAQSKQAAATPEPASVDPAKAPSAAEQAAAEADKVLEDMRPMLTEEERTQIDELLGQLDRDREERGSIIKEGAACLAAAVA